MDLGLIDFGARYYDPFTAHWTSVDPLAAKYPSISPYAYCSNDPINKIDPDGRKVVFDTNCSQEFRNKFAEAIQYMNEKGTSYNFAKLQKSEEIYTIKEGNKSRYLPGNKTIEWNPNVVNVDSKTKLMRSPVTVLCHEAGHAAQHDKAIKQGNEEVFSQSYQPYSDLQYDTLADKMVITTTEQYAAKHHNEIVNGQVTRFGHNGKSFQEVPVNGKIIDLSTKSQDWISRYVGVYNKMK